MSEEEIKDCIKILKDTDISTIEMCENTDMYTYSIAVKNVLNELDKKDKVIDLMARAINNYDSQLVINHFSNADDVKQYFYEKVEEEEYGKK